MTPSAVSMPVGESALLRHLPGSDATAGHRLVMVPHAGGGASMFACWPRSMPRNVVVTAVQLPGREDRRADPPPSAMSDVVADLVDALTALPPLPVTLFGHSLGAYIAFEVACSLAGDPHRTPPRRLVVSGSHPPHDASRPERMSHLDDDALLARLAELGGIPSELLSHRAYLTSVLPTLRADLRLAERYRVEPRPPLPCPITVLGGRDDPVVPPFCLDGWEQYSTAGVDRIEFEGGHFFLTGQHDQVAAVLAALLPGTAPATGGR